MDMSKEAGGQFAGIDGVGLELMENVQEVFFLTNADASIMHYISPAYERVWGLSRESVYRNPRSWMDAIVPEDMPRVLGTMATDPLRGMSYRILRPDGTMRSIEARAFPIKDGAGDVVRMVGIAEDVTERERVQADLRLSEERYRMLMENAPEAVMVLDCDAGRFVDFNRSALQLFGLTEEELRGAGPGELSALSQPDGRSSSEASGAFIREALEGGKPVFEWTCRTAGKSAFPCEVRLVRMPSQERRLVRATVTDISKRKALEEEFRQAQKMEAVGRLAGGVAHDFNNLLTVIMGFGQLLERRMAKGDPGRGDLEEILRASHRAAALSRQLLVFSRRHAAQLSLLDLNETVGQMQKLFGRVIGEDITLVSSLGAGLGSVRADPGQIEQVLMNLVVNARDAMPTGGKLTLETLNVELADDAVWRFKGLAPGPHVMLSVRDTGVGMTPEVKARIFEPFFTTKGPEKGTGLGLSTVYEIVRRSGGHVSVDSEPGRGSSFKIYFPRVEGAVGGQALQENTEPAGGGETVLIVEDEKDICALEDRILQGKGYKTLTAAGPAEALSLAEKHTGAVPLLVTDVVMPGMSGPDLAGRLKIRWPDMKVLYISGYTEGHLHDDDLLAAGTGLLHKPFAPSALARQVREMLDASAGL